MAEEQPKEAVSRVELCLPNLGIRGAHGGRSLGGPDGEPNAARLPIATRPGKDARSHRQVCLLALPVKVHLIGTKTLPVGLHYRLGVGRLSLVSEDRDDFRSQLEERIRRYAAQRDTTQAQLVELNHSLNATEKRLEAAVEMFRLEFGEEPASLPPGMTPAATRAPRRRTAQTEGPTWNDAVVAELTKAGGPLHINDLWSRLQEAGFETEAKDPIRALASVLVRHPDVHRTGPNTYGLRSQHGPEASIDELASENASSSEQGEAA